MDSLTTTIKREHLREIIAGRKKIEYREVKPYWEKRLSGISRPFQLRLINGMSANAPEATVRIDRITQRAKRYKLKIGRVMSIKNWDRQRECPK